MKIAAGIFSGRICATSSRAAGEQVMRFVDDQPVRPARPRAQRRDARQQLGEERGPLRAPQRLRVDDDVGRQLAQQLDGLVGGRRRLRRRR